MTATVQALQTAAELLGERAATVPLESGGTQVEWHCDGWDIEIEIGPDGKIRGVLVAREPEK